MTRAFKEGESCKECGTTKRKHQARGLCVNCYARTLRRENPEKYRNINKKYEQGEKRKKWLEEYKKTDIYKKMIKKSSTKYRENNKELMIERTRIWRQNNPDILEAYKSTAKDLKIVNKYGEEALRKMMECNYMCQKCGSDERVAVHHKDWDDANNVYENFAILCGSCHSKVHQFIPVRFRLELFKEFMSES